MLKYVASLLLLVSVAQAQVTYCGVDVDPTYSFGNTVPRQNLVNNTKYSDALDSWALNYQTITANTAVAPDGTITADTVTIPIIGATAGRYAYAPVTTVVVGTEYRIAGHFKYTDHPYVFIWDANNPTAYLLLNISAGTIIGRGALNLSSTMYPIGNGWYRALFTYKPANTSTFVATSVSENTTNNPGTSWSNGAVKTYYAWGFSHQKASQAMDYTPTAASVVALGPLCPLGYAQSLVNPNGCYLVGPVTRTDSPININMGR